MASNYSAYTPHDNHPQYVYYTPAVARHPAGPSYYFPQPIALQPIQAPGHLHPRSRSFNDLYAAQYTGHAVPAGMAPTGPPMFVPAPIPSAPPPAQEPRSHLRSVSSVSKMSATQAAAGQQSEAAPSNASSTSKPLRYRGRVARSKSYNTLAQPAPDSQAGPGPAMPSQGGRRLSSTSSLPRQKRYTGSMSSTDGGSTPSIMSSADTDSLTTQTSLSSTSSVDEESKLQKSGVNLRRSVADLLLEKHHAGEKEPETYKESEARRDSRASPTNEETVIQKPEPSEAVSAQVAKTSRALDAASSQVDPPEPGQAAPAQSKAEASSETKSESSELPMEKDVPTPSFTFSDEATVLEKPSAALNTVTDPEIERTRRSCAHSVSSETIELGKSVSGPVTTKSGPKPTNSTALKASEASQAREASVKTAKHAKETVPTSEPTRSTDTKDQEQEVQRRKQATRDTREKRATMATPVKLVLPSDLQPRSYHALNNTTDTHSEQKTTRSPNLHARSASWYTGAPSPVPVDDRLPVLHPPQQLVDKSTGSSQEPSAGSGPSVRDSSKLAPHENVFLRRSYASRQRPDVHSMPPRRPESAYSLTSVGATERQQARNSTSVYGGSPAVSSAPTSTNANPPKLPDAFLDPVPGSSAAKVRESRSFGSKLRSMFGKDTSGKTDKAKEDNSDAVSIRSSRSTKSSMSTRSTSSAFSFSGRFGRRKSSIAEPIEMPTPPPPAMSRRSSPALAQVPAPSKRPLSKPMINPRSSNLAAGPSPTEPVASRPPSPALSSIGKQVAPNLTAGDIYPGLLRPDDVDTLISSLERTGSFERKPSLSRRSKEEKVPNEQVIQAEEPVLYSKPASKPLKSAMKPSLNSPAKRGRRIGFAKNTLVYNTYSAWEYNRTPEPLPYNLHDRRVVVELYRELNELKMSMPVHPESKHHTQYVFERGERYSRSPVI